MKNLTLFLIISVCLLGYAGCAKKKSERFNLLTTPIWKADTLLAGGVDASGPGGLLEKFKGDAKFNEDGTGYFGAYKGEWQLSVDETEITIDADSLKYAIICDIRELTSQSLKITTVVPDKITFQMINIRMSFKAK